jgi:lipoprotein signal peptidase
VSAETIPSTVGAAPAAVEPAALVAPLRPALRDWASHLRFWGIAAAGLVLDLWSKDWAFRTLDYHRSRVLIPYVLEFQTVLNPGALFGIGEGLTTLFLLASFLALVLVIWMFAHSARGRWLFHLALGAILAGALGNVYDRLTVKLVEHPAESRQLWRLETGSESHVLREFPVRGPAERVRRISEQTLAELEPPVGYVRDFIKIPTRVFDRELWPWVFNVADMLLVGGVAVRALGLWTERKPAQG